MKLFLFFTSVLILPLAIIISRNGGVIELVPMLASSIGFALLLYALISLLRKYSPRVVAVAGAILLLVIMSVRYLLGFLYDFSGQGFSAEFFAHISRTSLEVGLQEYNHEAWIILIVFSAIVYFTARLINHQTQPRHMLNMALLPASALLIYAGSSASPEVQLAQAYARYIEPEQNMQGLPRGVIREQTGTLLKDIRNTAALPVEKNALEISAPDKPLNLVLVYLESFNEILTEQQHYPGLTPRIDELKQRYHSLSQIHSSGYVTIEGIANSQCGTLMNMEYANSSLVTQKGRLPMLPCLGDILSAAGYHQTYLGGANLEFAGKGPFLREHGYDRVLGWNHWDDLGHKKFNDWGLSDPELFDHAFDTIQERHQQDAPFNVSLLTLGMHTPGAIYEGCPVYTTDTDKPMVNAAHCTDFLLGRFVDRLEQAGILQDTVLFMQADHGSFITPEVVRQFSNSIADTRLLTIMALPDFIQIDADQIRAAKEGSNLDTVATLLDILDIRHNTSFIFSRSHFEPDDDPRYYLSRRQDYFDSQRFENNRYQCDDPDRSTPPTLPLDDCDKNRVMQAVSALNLSYTPSSGSRDNRLCELSAKIRIEADSKKIKVNWGNQNLSEQFYRRGYKRHKKQIKGIYAVLLDETNDVTGTLFFEAAYLNDIQDIQELYMKSISGQHMMLIHNVDLDELEPQFRDAWPAQLREHTIVYGRFQNQKLVPEFVSKTPSPDIKFTPQSCASDSDSSSQVTRG